MADDLSLLFKIRGDAAGAKQATAETRAAVSQLKSSLGSDFSQIQNLSNSAFTSIGNRLQVFAGQQVPLVGNALQGLTSQLGSAATEAEGMGASLAGVAGPIGIAVVAIAALTAGAIALAEQFVQLTISTADWEGKLFDLAQQTGVSVETLSTLEAVAETTGGSIESVAQSLVIFQGKLEEAQDGASKTAKQFKDLNISTRNTEQAFRDAVKALAAMPEGFHQTNEAAELFGKRGGKQVLAILKETQGDIDGTTRKLRELNSLVTTEVAQSADALNDQLKGVQRQFRGVQAQIVNESMPLIIKALQDFSRILRDNREVIETLGAVISHFVDANLKLIAPAVLVAETAIRGMNIHLRAHVELYERLKALMQWISGNTPNVDPNGIPAVKSSTGIGAIPSAGDMSAGAGIFRKKAIGGGGGGGRSTVERISEGQRLLNALTDEYNRLQEKANNLTRVQSIGLEILDKKYQGLTATLRDQILTEAAQIDRANQKAEIDKRKADATEKIRAFVERQSEAVKKARLGDEEWTDALAELDAELKKLGLSMDADTRKTLEKNNALIQTISLTRERIALEQTLIDRMERQRAVEKENQDRLMGIEHSDPEATRRRQVGIDENRPTSAIDQLFGDINDKLSGTTQTAALAGLEALTSAFQSLGQAVGQVVEAWVLYGSAGTSVRKVTAQILAGVAQQAAVKAVFELAEGFAALALAFFGLPNAGPSASAHFAAAAIYGSIAGVAALAGRAVAGDAFKQPSAGGAGAGSRTGSSGATRNAPDVTDINRRAVQPVINITVVGQATEGFRYMVEKVAVDSVRLNGPFRKIQNGEDV